MNYSKEELNEAFKRLPEELQDVFLSIDVTDSIGNIGRKYNLHIDKIGDLDSETGLVLLGLTHPTEFVSSLTKRLGIDRTVASQIASEINDQVFLKIRGLLKDVQKGDTKKEEEEELEPRPSRDALLAALEHPEGMLKRPVQKQEGIPFVEIRNPYEPAKPQMGKDIPVVAPVPVGVLGDTTSYGRTDLQVPPTAEVSEDSTLRSLNPQKPETPVADEKPSVQAPPTDILTQKMSGQFSTQSTESTRKVDPYKEAV